MVADSQGRVEPEAHDVGVNHDISVGSSCCSGKSCATSGLVEVEVRVLVGKAASSSGGSSVGASDAVDGDGSVVLGVVDLSNRCPYVSVGSVKSAGHHDVGEGDESPGGDGSVSGVTEIHNDSHSGILVFKGDFEDGEGVEGLGAGSLEAAEGESIAKNVDDFELVKGEVLVVVLVGTIVVGVEGVQMDDASRQLGNQRGVLTVVLEVGLSQREADQSEAEEESFAHSFRINYGTAPLLITLELKYNQRQIPRPLPSSLNQTSPLLSPLPPLQQVPTIFTTFHFYFFTAYLETPKIFLPPQRLLSRHNPPNLNTYCKKSSSIGESDAESGKGLGGRNGRKGPINKGKVSKRFCLEWA